ncbi:hypothetical protein A2774_00325 [Candidatus Roizmanbacteria bacterium RIFCSPHIGHO2_01_FULL_39_12c]|uniref:Hydrogenase maturation protease n=1 Tax=Candidatus Roizmanbacteria bacterium RIFCSPHIGHO2_01_FULL_39_12c TaxID=1802031 RepID=A0A1F7GDG4_9BACT|nr:MAG: hypothetical protein A2774_00325 [Candidatus Roizmanbacteria bacterium RIFCSPHIGHO2_01_FULL_39_12c]
MKIYVFGNSMVKEDNLGIKIIPELKKFYPEISFEIVDPNENFPPENEKNLTVIDTVEGLKKPKLFTLADLREFQKTPNSPHDYDLGMHLLLLKKLKKIDTVNIIGAPSGIDRKLFINWLIKVIPDLIGRPG